MIRKATIDDTEFILSVFDDKDIKDYLCDDASRDVQSVDIDSFLFLICGDDGFFLLVPKNGVAYELHVAFLPKCRGQKVNEYAKDMFEWLSENTPAKKLIAEIPKYNYRAKAAAIKNGFVLHGISTNSFMKNNRLMDQYIYGKEL